MTSVCWAGGVRCRTPPWLAGGLVYCCQQGTCRPYPRSASRAVVCSLRAPCGILGSLWFRGVGRDLSQAEVVLGDSVTAGAQRWCPRHRRHLCCVPAAFVTVRHVTDRSNVCWQARFGCPGSICISFSMGWAAGSSCRPLHFQVIDSRRGALWPPTGSDVYLLPLFLVGACTCQRLRRPLRRAPV